MQPIFVQSKKGFENMARFLKSRLFASRRCSSRIALPNVEIEINLIAGQAVDMLPPAVLRVVDMSAQGIRLECMLQYPLPPGERMNIYFYNPAQLNGMRVVGSVRYCNMTINRSLFGEPSIYHIGCEFIFPNAETRSRFSDWAGTELIKFIERRTPVLQEWINALTLKPSTRWYFDSVQNAKELMSAFDLAQMAYWKREAKRNRPLKSFFNFHSLLPHSRTFIGMDKKETVCGAVSLIPDTRQYRLPIDRYFPEHTVILRSEGRKIGEVGMLAINQNIFPKHSFSLGNINKMRFLFQLFRTMFINARESLGLDDILIMVHPEHADLYKYLYFTEESRSSLIEDGGSPVVLLRLDIHQAAALSYVENKPLYKFFFPREPKMNNPHRPLVLRPFELEDIVKRNDVLSQLDRREKDILSVLYGSFESCLGSEEN